MAQALPAQGGQLVELWPHQHRAFLETLQAIGRGERRILVTSPTGGGKTRIMQVVITHYLERGEKIVLYTNRKLLVDQTSRVLAAAGLTHGVRAAGHDDERYLDLQVSSIQTESSRVLKRNRWGLHEADLVLVDEAHLQSGKTARTILAAHRREGAACVGFTATPLDLGDLYDTLVVAGTTSELRACGALVPCFHYGPDEPDLRHIGKVALGADLTEKQNVKAIMTHGVFGRVLEWYRKLNPEGKPAILFAPGVAESLWFAEQFHAAGITAAHIDGKDVWINGRLERTSPEARRDALAGSRNGRIQVLCNRFVLREGIDAPWLGHGIFATVFGSLQSYLQSGGRLLRSHPSLASVTLQDHGGNWWRHGSLNADREWRLDWTANVVTGLREERLRAKAALEPVRCPQCAAILLGLRCRCGWEAKSGKRSRPVIQSDGSMKEMKGSIFKPRRICQKPDAAKLWEKMYHRAKSAKWDATFRQAEAMFASENNWQWPDRSMPLMPTNPLDWFAKVAEVPVERLTRKEN